MTLLKRLTLTLFLSLPGCLLMLTLATVAIAQEAESSNDDAHSAERSAAPPTDPIVPPRLMGQLSPPYPTEALGTGLSGTVGLRVTVAKDGSVTSVELVSGIHHALDQAALDYASTLKFEPARRGERPVAARILVAAEFQAPLPPAASPRESPSPKGPVDSATGGREVLPPTSRVAPRAVKSESEVVVRGRPIAERLKHSPHAVEVLELDRAHRTARDLGDVLAHSTGAVVRRSGGLGSREDISLAGMTEDRVRVFVDGIPIAWAGYPFGLANVPVNLIDRVGIYHGVVPVRLGADTLGGAVELVTDQGVRSNRTYLSMQAGSYETFRFSGAAQAYLGSLKSFARVTGFHDSAANDYPIDVDVVNSRGQLSPATVQRFHDGYKAQGLTLSVGTVDRSWADRLILSAFLTSHDREVQSDPAMLIPYGEVTFGKESRGVNLRYRKASTPASFEVAIGYADVMTSFKDVSSCRYGWRGECLVDLGIRGEIDQIPSDRVARDRAFFLRAYSTLVVARAHRIHLAATPATVTRKGDDAELTDDEYDSYNDPQTLASSVFGAEWEADALAKKLTNIFFAKSYAQRAVAKQLLVTGEVDRPTNTSQRFGGGNSLRYFLAEEVFFKASYEYATRLPNSDEYFGDAGLVVRNIELTPEQSHNINLEAHATSPETRLGTFRGTLVGFGRKARDLITLVSAGTYLQYENILEADVRGVRGNLGWSSPKDYASVYAQASYTDVRNRSKVGPMDAFAGDRIPHMPYLQGSAEIVLRAPRLTHPDDVAELSFQSRYVHEYFRSWESAGEPQQKLTVESQLTHGAALTYVTQNKGRELSSSVEMQNMTNEKVFDFYGVERPGRTIHVKFTLDL